VSSGWLGGVRSSPDLHGKGIGDPFELHVGVPRHGPRPPGVGCMSTLTARSTRTSLVHLPRGRAIG
jgi:hypothetical protein